MRGGTGSSALYCNDQFYKRKHSINKFSILILLLLVVEMEIEVNKVFLKHKLDQQQNNILLMI